MPSVLNRVRLTKISILIQERIPKKNSYELRAYESKLVGIIKKLVGIMKKLVGNYKEISGNYKEISGNYEEISGH